MKCLAVVFVILVSVSPALSQRSKYDPAPRKPASESSGFVDFALGRINPNNTDYGCQIDQNRRLFVEQTLHNLDFWVIGITVSLLILSFFMLLHQNRERDRRDIIVAGLLAQYHNAWVQARGHADDAIRRHNELANAAAESTLRAASQEADQTHTKSEQSDSSSSTKPSTKHWAAPNGGARVTENRDNRSDSSGQPHEVQIDSIAQISVLQKQLEASRERENNLRKQLAEVERRCRLLESNNSAVSG